jgi:hypothetical protein
MANMVPAHSTDDKQIEWATKCKLLSVVSIKQQYPINVARYKIRDKYGFQLSR